MKPFIKNCTVWLLLLSMFLCLFVSGCESKPAANADGKKPDVADAKIPEKTQLEVKAEAELYYENMFRYYPCRYDSAAMRNIYPARSTGDYIYGYGINEISGGTSIVKFDLYGNLISETKIRSYTTRCSVIDEDRFLNSANLGSVMGMSAAMLQMDGTAIDYVQNLPIADNRDAQNPFASTNYGKGINDILYYLGDDCILAGYYFDLYIFRQGLSGKPVHVDLPGAIEGIERLDENTLLMFSPKKLNDSWESLFHTIDMDTGEVYDYAYDDAHPDPMKIFENIEHLYYQDGAYYARCKDGIYSYRDGERKFLLSWAESYLNSGEIELVQILSDDCFVVSYRNGLTNQIETGSLIRETIQREKPREVITLASVGLGYRYRNFLQGAVDEFNRNNTDYLVYYHDYAAAHEGNGVMQEAVDKLSQEDFEFDLINGIVYDCYVFPENSPNRKMLADKNALIDLTPYLDNDNLLGCVKTAYSTEQGIIGMPFFINLSTLVTNQTTLLSTRNLTWDVLYEYAENLKPGESLFDEEAFDRLRLIGSGDFIDYDNHTCDFDNEDFIRYLRFLAEIHEGKYYDGSAAVIGANHPTPFEDNNGSYSAFSLHGFDAQRRSVLGQLKFSMWDFCSKSSLSALMLAYHQQNINYCGYPSKDGTGVLMYSGAVFSATTIANCPDGAAAFMNYLYSDHIQCCSAAGSFGLPVTRNAIRVIFPTGYVYYFVTNAYTGTYGDNIIFFTQLAKEPTNYADYFQFVRVTEEDCEKFIRFLDRAKVIHTTDGVVKEIIDEEVSYFVGGVRSAEDAARIIQNRLYIYLNE